LVQEPLDLPNDFVVQKTFLKIGLAAACLLVTKVTGWPDEQTMLPDAEIHRMLQVRVEQQRGATGAVVGIAEPSGNRVIAYGKRGLDDPTPVNGDTVYDIGSITKVFTALVLSDMAQKHELGLDDPAAKY